MDLNDVFNTLKDTRNFAVKKHAGQMYDGKLNYMYHIDEVFRNGVLYDLDFYELLACILHDVLEDTDATEKDLLEFLPEEVVKIVTLVTNYPGKNRKEKHEKTYPELRKSKSAVAVKLCDRIANINHCMRTGNIALLQMYLKEDPEFRQLETQGENVKLWMTYSSMVLPYLN